MIIQVDDKYEAWAIYFGTVLHKNRLKDIIALLEDGVTRDNNNMPLGDMDDLKEKLAGADRVLAKLKANEENKW